MLVKHEGGIFSVLYIETPDFVNIDFKDIIIDDFDAISKLPMSIDDARQLPVSKEFKVNMISAGKSGDLKYYIIERGLDLHFNLHESWVMLFRDLIKLSEDEICRRIKRSAFV